jgi:hypothetical protein
MKHAYEILISLHRKSDRAVSTMLDEMHRFALQLESLSPNLRDWWLAGETKEEALRYKVLKDGQVTGAALSVLEEKLEDDIDPRIITLWNGRERHEGASLRLMARPEQHLSNVTFVGRPKSFSSDWRLIADVLKAGTAIWSPSFITVETNGYFDCKMFKDRPGIGWMLYLPRVLTAQQVPEARALVPVMIDSDGKKQKRVQGGTIIVSVTDEPFSDENPEHVKIANAIEIRLVDQDLLPRYADL